MNGLYTYILWLPTEKQPNDNVGMIILGSYTVDLPNKKQDNVCCWIFQGGAPYQLHMGFLYLAENKWAIGVL